MDELNCCGICCDGDYDDNFLLDGECSMEQNADGECGIVQRVSSFDAYSGPYEITPTQETQTLGTHGKLCNEDIVINPIPQNYGLITWNGYSIKVS